MYCKKSRVKVEAPVWRGSLWRLSWPLKGALFEADNPPLCCHTDDRWRHWSHRKIQRVRDWIPSKRVANGPAPCTARPVYFLTFYKGFCVFVRIWCSLCDYTRTCQFRKLTRFLERLWRGTSGNRSVWLPEWIQALVWRNNVRFKDILWRTVIKGCCITSFVFYIFTYSLFPFTQPLFIIYLVLRIFGARGGAVGWGTALQAGRSRVRLPMVSLELFIRMILPAALWPWGWLRF